MSIQDIIKRAQKKLKDNSIDDQDYTIYDARVVEIYDAIKEGTYKGPTVGSIDTKMLVIHRTNLQCMISQDFDTENKAENLISKGIKSGIKKILFGLFRGLFKIAKFVPKIIKTLLSPAKYITKALKYLIDGLGKIISNLFGKAGEILKAIGKGASKVWNFGANLLKRGTNLVKNTASKVGNKIVKWGNKLAKGGKTIANAVSKTISKANKVVKPLTSVVKTSAKIATAPVKLAGKATAIAAPIISLAETASVVSDFKNKGINNTLDSYEKDLEKDKLEYLNLSKVSAVYGGKLGDKIGDVFMKHQKAKWAKIKSKQTDYGAFIKEEDVPKALADIQKKEFGDKWFEAYHLGMWAKYSEEGRAKAEETFEYLDTLRLSNKRNTSEVSSEDIKNLKQLDSKFNSPIEDIKIKNLENKSITKKTNNLDKIKIKPEKNFTPINVVSIPKSNMSRNLTVLNTGYRV